MKRGDHLKGARMLIRVSNNISKFPARKLQNLIFYFSSENIEIKGNFRLQIKILTLTKHSAI